MVPLSQRRTFSEIMKTHSPKGFRTAVPMGMRGAGCHPESFSGQEPFLPFVNHMQI